MNKHISPKLSRRAFVIGTAAAGAGLSIGLDIPFGGPTVVRAADGSPEVNAWVVIRPDDTVVIRIARSEMGQGSLTGLAQLVAEELECDWSKVTTEYPTPGQSVARKRAWGDFSTGGSRGIRTSQEYVRKGGATARMMLVQAAADEWKVPVAECTASNSVITHTPSGKKTTYGKVVEAAAKLQPPADVKLKDPKDWKIAGKGLKRLDTEDKTTGKMMYGIDVKLPGMLNAAIKDCPVFGGSLKSFDEAKIANMKGVKKVVRVGDTAVAVVADTWWHAKTALEALPIVWDEGDNVKVSSESIAIRRRLPLSATRTVTPRRRSQVRRRRSRRSTTIPTKTTPVWSRSTPRHSTPQTDARCGAARKTAKRRLPPRWKHQDYRPTSAKYTSRCSAAVSAGAA
jgi:isoquinoline 1-oxidoreductase beta subunit